MDVHIWQFDSNTGPCSFLGSFSGFMDRGYNSDRLSQFGYMDSPDYQWLMQDCPELDSVFSKDNLLVYAVYLGSYSYETMIGFNTVPAFQIVTVNHSRSR